jgi:adenine phosphoribosyltransferase
MSDTDLVRTDARAQVLGRFRWIDGHADVWHVFRDPIAFRTVIQALADPYRTVGVTAVAGVESRGFLLGGAVAMELGVGFVAIRKAGALFPGRKIRQRTEPDYRGNRPELLLQEDSVSPSDQVILVDDWVETGSQAQAVQTLLKARGTSLLGISVLVDGLPETRRSTLPPVHGVIRISDLPTELATR